MTTYMRPLLNNLFLQNHLMTSPHSMISAWPGTVTNICTEYEKKKLHVSQQWPEEILAQLGAPVCILDFTLLETNATSVLMMKKQVKQPTIDGHQLKTVKYQLVSSWWLLCWGHTHTHTHPTQTVLGNVMQNVTLGAWSLPRLPVTWLPPPILSPHCYTSEPAPISLVFQKDQSLDMLLLCYLHSFSFYWY